MAQSMSGPAAERPDRTAVIWRIMAQLKALALKK